MAGLEIESGDDHMGLSHLAKDEALQALRYATSELNGFPSWLELLYRAHPREGFDLLWDETRWELANSGAEPMHYMLHNFVYHAPWLHADMAWPIYHWLPEHGAANGDCLRYHRNQSQRQGAWTQGKEPEFAHRYDQRSRRQTNDTNPCLPEIKALSLL